MYQLTFYVPESHTEAVKTAIFEVGGGTFENYSHVCWQTLGTGQFKPLSGSQPFLGENEKLTKVSEFKIELICDDLTIKRAVKAMKGAHPYEEPAYHVIQLEEF